MRVGVLTGGGDCPGLNAVIRGIVRTGTLDHDCEFIGFRDGWRGPLEADTQPLDIQAVRGILPRGGTILGSSRTNPLADAAAQGGKTGLERVTDNLASLGVDALIAIGGEDTLGVADKLSQAGVKVVGVPKTIDNDLGATDYTFGFDTAVNIAMEAIDRLHTTAESHHRALIVEVMGRHAGWIALHAGLAGGANVILIPENPFDIEDVCAYVEKRFETRYAPIVVVAEGAHPKTLSSSVVDQDLDAFGHVRQGGPRRGARAHPARRHADGVRPGARDAVRHPCDPRGHGRRVRDDGRSAGHRDRPGSDRRGDPRAQDGSAGALRRGRGLLRLRLVRVHQSWRARKAAVLILFWQLVEQKRLVPFLEVST
jgi:6-phosphofructokinase